MPQMTIEQAMQVAIEHHQAGRLDEAEQLYRQVLVQKPDHANALRLSGIAAMQRGRADLAVELTGRAIALSPHVAEYHVNHANALKADGKIGQAIESYRRAVGLKSDYPQAYYNLGIALAEQRQFDQAIDAYRRAVQLKPDYLHAHNNLGVALSAGGRLDEAVAAYRAALSLQPDLFDTLRNLVLCLNKRGDFDEAMIVARRAIELKPDSAEAHTSLGMALAGKEEFDPAIEAYRIALRIRSNYPEAHNNLGVALAGKGQIDEAIAAYSEAVRLNPDFGPPHMNLGNALRKRGRLDESIAACRQAVRLQPDDPEPCNSLGVALCDAGNIDEALAVYRKALEIKSDHYDVHNNLGNLLMEKGQFDLARAEIETALRLRPDASHGHWNLANLLLLTGDFEHGWDEYEWRWRHKSFPSIRPDYQQKQWRGEELQGRTILIHREQGFGDMIQFARYAPLLAGRGARVIFACQPELSRLLGDLPGVELAIAPAPLPPFDLYCPLLSLPQAFKTRLESIPATVPYLRADPLLAEAWSNKLKSHGDRLKVGLAWAGSPQHAEDRKRSLRLSQLAPLAKSAGVRFFSLQRGEAAARDGHDSAGMREVDLIDYTGDLHDFTDTAALISQLDLVIAVDTAVVHLAGALGKAVWVLLPFKPDWRWMLEREDSPWYPTMRLFRQKSAGDWAGAIEAVAAALDVFSNKGTDERDPADGPRSLARGQLAGKEQA